MALARTNVLGVGVSAINMDLALETIRGWIERREQHFVTVTGVHGVMESQRDEKIRDIHNRAGMVTPDGMPLVWLSRLKGQSHVRRVYGPDLMLAVCQDGLSRGYRHYLYGGAEGVPALLSDKLRERFPGIQIVGAFSPPFRVLSPEEDEQIVRDVNAAQPDIVWVGLSTPKQERWMDGHAGRVQAPVMVGVGAAFDFHSGLKKQAPKWVQGSGMEWFFRLVMEPRRLAKRYLINNPTFIALVAGQLLGLRKYSLPE
jgi:N-acetylglucosaminyldiphosphoundecaprenol N-acetyl-beta-D-mannosaminyltransferase